MKKKAKKKVKRKSSKKCYVVISEKKKHTYGAFPFTPEGLKKAKAYLRILKKEHKEEFIVRET